MTTIKRKPKEWFDKNEKLNVNYTIQLGDKLYVSGSNDIWVVVEINEGGDIEDRGSILIKKEFYNSTYTNIYNDPEFNNYYESYVHFGWQRWARIIHSTSEDVMAGVISTAPYKNWQEWLDSEEGKRIISI
jgi:hypothetical protein